MTEEPLYNIGVVTRVTGIPIPTLHAWERRYGFPSAARTSGGHRLFSEKDIARLRWVKSQMDLGFTVSRAIAAARSLEAEGRLSLSSSPITIQSAVQTEVPSPAASNRKQEIFMDALIRHDLAHADQLMGEMLAFASPEELTLDVIAPTLVQLGNAWEQGQISIATEHLASNYLRHRLLMWMVTGPSPKPMKPIVLSCAPNEWHEGSLLMFGVLLRRRGWPVAYLGQNVPLPDLAKFVREIQPPIVVLVAMRPETAASLTEWPQWIEQLAGRPAISFAGRIFISQPELRDTMPGIYLGDTLTDGVQKIEGLLRA